MKKNLEIGEKVLMFSLEYKENGNLDLVKTFITSSPKEVMVTKHDNVLTHDIFTVIDNEHNEYCGVYLCNDQFGEIALVRREEFVMALLNIYNRFYIDGYINGYMNTEESVIRMIRHQLNSLCNHLFVKQRDGCWIGGFHSSDYEYENSIVTCVHCGLTNRYCEFNHLKLPIDIKLGNEAFTEYLNMCPSNIGYSHGNEKFIPLLSERVYFFDRPRKLYLEAKEIKPDATNEELFEIMKEIDINNINKIEKEMEKHKKLTKIK